MTEYLVYTTEGYTSAPNPDINVENCQVLGRIEGLSEEDAIDRLFNRNAWLERAGFTESQALAVPTLYKKSRKNLN